MTRSSMRAVLVLAFLCFFASGSPAQLNYSEPPDLSGSAGSPTILGSLAAGVNSVQGSVSATASVFNGQPSGDLADTFTITIPAALRVTSVQIVITGFSSTVPTPARLVSLSTSSVAGFSITGGTTSPNLLTPAGAVLGGGAYSFRIETLLSPSITGSSCAFSYSVRFLAEDCSSRVATATATPMPCFVSVIVDAGAYASEVYRSTDPADPGQLLGGLPAGGHEWSDMGAVPGVAYYYRARVVAGAGGCVAPGDFSQPVEASPLLPDAPAAPTITNATGCTVTWNTDSSIAGYRVAILDAVTRTQVYSVDLPRSTPSWTMPVSGPSIYDFLGPAHTAVYVVSGWRACSSVLGPSASSTSQVVALQRNTDTIQVTLANTPCGVTIDWTPSTGFQYVELRRSDGVTFPGVIPIFVDTSAADAATYTYTVAGLGCTGASGSAQITCSRAGVTALPAVRVRDGATAVVPGGPFPAAFGPTYSWRRGGLTPADPAGVPVSNSTRIGGATTTTLTIQRAGPADTDTYWCIAHYALPGCGEPATSTNLFLSPACPADFNKSGQANVQDIFDFLSAWFVGCP